MSNIYSVGNGPVVYTYANSLSFQQLSQSEKDTLTQALSPAQLNARFSFDVPSLTVPEVPLSNVFQIINETTVLFRRQLQVAALVDQGTRRLPSQAAAEQAAIVGVIFTNRANAVADSQQQAALAIAQLEQELNQFQSQTVTQESEIQGINAGNIEEQRQTQQQIQAYNNFIQIVKQLGGIDNGDGTYTIPAGSDIQAYNNAANAYYNQTSNFNSYVNVRKQEINNYNALTNNYNSTVSQNIQTIQAFINQYNLADYLNQNQIPSMYQSVAGNRDTSQMSINDYPTQSISGSPANVHVAPPPAWVNQEQNGVPSIANISYTGLTDQQLKTIQDGIYKFLYTQNVNQFDTLSQAQVQYWAFLNMLNLFNPVQDSTPDPLLNNKRVSNKILPDALINITQPVKADESGGGELIVQVAGLGSPELQNLLSKALLLQTVKNINLNLNQRQANDLANAVLLLTTNLLNANALQSLFPGLGPLSNYLSSLPANSPAYSLLFSISFANRIQELTQQGSTTAALETLIAKSPELANLDAASKNALVTQLTPILNLSLALVATKLLESNLGLSGLSAQLLPSFLPSEAFTPEQINTIINAGIQEQSQTQANLNSQITTNFIGQGFKPEEAQFLAQFGTDLTAQGLLTPSLSSVSSENVQQPLLTNSVTAGLVLEGRSLPEAEQIAEQAVNTTLEGGALSLNQFYANLETQLRTVGVGQEATEIAKNAIALPLPEPTISLPNEPAANPTTAPIEALSKDQLTSLLKRKILELLAPQIDIELAKNIASEAAKTVFGPNPGSADLNDVKSTYSLVNVVRNETSHIIAQSNEQHTEALSNSFKELIKDDVNLYSFERKLMDPANVLVYSMGTGIMYAGHEPSNWKRSVDIQV